jgi:hypothetical protein
MTSRSRIEIGENLASLLALIVILAAMTTIVTVAMIYA